MMRRYGGSVQSFTFPATTISDIGKLQIRWDKVDTTISSTNSQSYQLGIPSDETKPFPFTRIQLVNAVFPSYDEIHIAGMAFIESLHFVGVNGDIASSAVAVATALNATPGVTCAVDDGDSSILNIFLDGNVFGQYSVSVINKTDPANFNADVSGDFDGYFERQSLLEPPDRT